MLRTEYSEKEIARLMKRDAREEGRAEGFAEGRAEGFAEGRAEGFAEGRAEGRTIGKIKACCSLIEDGILTVEKAAEKVGLSPEEFLRKAELLKQNEESPVEKAIDDAIKSCLEEGVLADLLREHTGEVKGMLMAEFYEDEVMRYLEEDAGEEGKRLLKEIVRIRNRVESINLGYSTLEGASQELGMTPEEFLHEVDVLRLLLHNPRKFIEVFGGKE